MENIAERAFNLSRPYGWVGFLLGEIFIFIQDNLPAISAIATTTAGAGVGNSSGKK